MMPQSENNAWLRVAALAFAAFIFNTTEFIPIALLSDIAAGFAMPVPQAGLMMTVYAWVVTLMSLPFMLLTANMERRRLLLILFAVFIVGHALSVAAWNFETLLLSRVVIALAHAVFWSVSAALVMRLAPKGRQQQALGWMSLGSAMAAVLGLPLGRLIGQALGWRSTLGLIGVLAAGIMVLLFRLLPRLESRNAGSLKSLPLLLKRPLLLGLYALTMIAVTAHFTAYSYIEPYVLDITKMSADTATAVLLVFGVSGMIASWLFGRFYPQSPNVFLNISAAVLTLSLAALYPLGGSAAAVFVLVLLWGIGISCLSLSMVSRVLHHAPDATDVATSIYSGIYNIGIGGGALLGGMVMNRLGLTAVGWVGAALAATGLAVYVFMEQKYRE